MFPVRRIAALVLVALWLPALLHCRLEAAGLMPWLDCCESSGKSAANDPCADDSCEVAEGEFTKPSSTSLTTPAPVLVACLFSSLCPLPALEPFPPPVTGVVEASAAPPDVIRSWVFVSRAALPPRAPSRLFA